MNDWISSIDRISSKVKDEFGSLTNEQIHWRPDAGTWSIAQNLDHLRVVNESYFPALLALKAGTYQVPFIAKIGFLVSFFGKTILRAVQPDRRNKMKTFPIWQPSMSIVSDLVVDRFIQHQDELKRQMEEATALLNKGIVISSPANKNIVYTLETAFDIIIAHEKRHLEQALELLKLLNEQADN